MSKRVLLLCNSTAGTGSVKNRLFTIVSELAARNYEVTVQPVVPKRGLFSEPMIKQAKDRFDLIVVCGGDGTLNHAINEMMKYKVKLPIGYIPSGSANDFSKNIYDSFEIVDMCEAIAEGKPFAYDLGKLNQQYFNYVAAFGAFSDVSYMTDQEMKNSLGYAAYVIQTLATLPNALNYKVHMKIEHDDKVEEGDFILGTISNSISVAGMTSPLLKKAQINDGLFEVLLIKAPKNIGEANEILKVLPSGQTNSYVKSFTTNKLVITSDDEVSWSLDGEDGGKTTKATIRVVPKAMKIMVKDKE